MGKFRTIISNPWHLQLTSSLFSLHSFFQVLGSNSSHYAFTWCSLCFHFSMTMYSVVYLFIMYTTQHVVQLGWQEIKLYIRVLNGEIDNMSQQHLRDILFTNLSRSFCLPFQHSLRETEQTHTQHLGLYGDVIQLVKTMETVSTSFKHLPKKHEIQLHITCFMVKFTS